MHLTQAQQEERSTAIETLVRECASINDDALLMAVEALIEARPNVDPHKLQSLAHRLSGIAWDMQRGL